MSDPTATTASQEQTPHKPGYKTSEFWLSLAAFGAGFLQASGVIGDSSATGKLLGLAVSGLAAMGYAFNRTWLKKQ